MKKFFRAIIACTAFAACTSNEQCVQTQERSETDIVVENIMARRSIRKYTEQTVSRDTLEQIIACGINAPNGMNLASASSTKSPSSLLLAIPTRRLRQSLAIVKKCSM